MAAPPNRIQEAPTCLGFFQVGIKDPLRMSPYQTALTANAASGDLRQYTVSSQMLQPEVQILILLERPTNWTSVDFYTMKASRVYLVTAD